MEEVSFVQLETLTRENLTSQQLKKIAHSLGAVLSLHDAPILQESFPDGVHRVPLLGTVLMINQTGVRVVPMLIGPSGGLIHSSLYIHNRLAVE